MYPIRWPAWFNMIKEVTMLCRWILPWEITQIHNQYEDAGKITSCIEVKPHLRSLYNQSWESNHKPTHKKQIRIKLKHATMFVCFGCKTKPCSTNKENKKSQTKMMYANYSFKLSSSSESEFLSTWRAIQVFNAAGQAPLLRGPIAKIQTINIISTKKQLDRTSISAWITRAWIKWIASSLQLCSV